jgi:hypothetical protein
MTASGAGWCFLHGTARKGPASHATSKDAVPSPIAQRQGAPCCLTQLCCDKAPLTENHHRRVIVIAGSSEGLIALARLINSPSFTFPVPLVGCVHGLHDAGVVRLVRKSLDAPGGWR